MGINLNAHGYAEAQTAIPGEFVKLPPGGYVCVVINAEVTYAKSSGNPMLVLFLDITEGEFKRYFNEATTRSKSFNPDRKWDSGGIFRQNIFNNDNKISPFFKGLISVFLQCNPNLKINCDDFDPDCFFGAQIGFVFAEEAYKFNDKTGVRVVPKTPKTVEDIRSGNFKIPELKNKPAQETPKTDYDDLGGTPVDTEDTPF